MDYRITPGAALAGEISVPGSKSHTIRAVVAGLLGRNWSEIHAPLLSGDTRSALNAARALGAEAEISDALWRIRGCGGDFSAAAKRIDMGNSGTSLRIMTAAAALGAAEVTFDGDASLRTRIMRGELDALAALGARTRDTGGFAPLTVSGPLTGGRARVDGTTSQYLSALLMALPLARRDSVLELDFLNEADYVRITLDWLARCGVTVHAREDLLRFEIPGGQRYQAFSRVIPADFSTAAFPLGAGVIAGREVRIANLDFTDLQGDKRVFDFVREMGGDLRDEAGYVAVRRSELRGGTFDLNATPDALPLMAVLGCCAAGETRLVNVPQARLKETDRIACMTAELRKMGAEIEELADGMVIRGAGRLHGAEVQSHADHRIAMALAVAALGADGETVIRDGGACGVTYPGFAADFRRLGARIAEF
ncbi:MAG: 3-phosphoshikimate 1-carboxyvinyltransferase [Lentisphaeria bacterium]|nr:3-phosphoshikimate 1-carboxyvinyltransferase [Lentisphaeria bacterium]